MPYVQYVETAVRENEFMTQLCGRTSDAFHFFDRFYLRQLNITALLLKFISAYFIILQN